MTGQGRASIADRVKELRRQMGVNQAEFGGFFGVDQSIVSKWEKGSELPGSKQLIRLGNFARERSDKELFWESAALDLDAFDQLADWRAKVRRTLGNIANDNIYVPLLETTSGGVPFPAGLIPASARLSVRSHRLRSSGKSFSIGNLVYDQPDWPTAGDVLLLDTNTTDLRNIPDHEFIAVRIQAANGKSFHDYAGTLLKVREAEHTQYRLWKQSDSIYLGLSLDGHGPIKLPGLDSRVLGSVLAWVKRRVEREKE
jgi:transcriptional regulator with XRE-family HTH domain